MPELRKELIEVIRARGLEHRDVPFRLSSGQLSNDYIDGKRALGRGQDLILAGRAVIEAVGAEFDAVGGRTMGADPIAHAVSALSGSGWFSVRKEPKGHGKAAWTEGMELGEGTRVVIVDDIVTTGKSIVQALDVIQKFPVQVLCAIAMVDRGEAARALLSTRGIAYIPLITYQDLGIEPTDGPIGAAATG